MAGRSGGLRSRPTVVEGCNVGQELEGVSEVGFHFMRAVPDLGGYCWVRPPGYRSLLVQGNEPEAVPSTFRRVSPFYMCLRLWHAYLRLNYSCPR